MIKIENIRKHILTTIIGSFFLIADFVYFIYPMVFSETVADVGTLFAGAFIGLGLWLSPDTLFKSLKDKITKT